MSATYALDKLQEAAIEVAAPTHSLQVKLECAHIALQMLTERDFPTPESKMLYKKIMGQLIALQDPQLGPVPKNLVTMSDQEAEEVAVSIDHLRESLHRYCFQH